MLSRWKVALALIVVVTGVAGAAVAVTGISGGAVASVPADRIAAAPGDLVTMFDVEQVDREVVTAAFTIAERSGGAAATARSGSAGMVRITRGGATVHAPPSGYLIPLVYLAMPPAALAGVVGTDVSAVLGPDTLVMNQLTADQTGAQVGDTVEMRWLTGPAQGFRIAAIIPYDQIGGSEVVFTTAAGERMGVVDDTRVVVWGIDDRAAADVAITELAMETRRDTQVLRSWEASGPDVTLSTARLKQALGEPWYRLTGDSTIAMHPSWIADNLTDGRVLLDPGIPVRARCHRLIVDDLSAALAEVAAAGLASTIDVGNTNTYGGCFNPRYSRLGGFLSRHAYAAAIDMNTLTNCQGCVPRMDCRVVRIFRKHGFAWGGNFRRPDGMHFEWVGRRLDQSDAQATYCPNTSSATTQSVERASSPAEVGRDVLVEGADALPLHVHDH